MDIREFTASNSSTEKLSAVPTCYFSEDANSYWNSDTYTILDALLGFDLPNYQKAMDEANKMPSDLYKYPKCNLFSKMPTNTGICHTFNGLDLQDILKPTKWTDTFSESFGDSSPFEMFYSEGIDIDDGFVFSVDTLQSYFVNMKDRPAMVEFENVNSFYLKVHPHGEIPWMQQDKSSWNKINAHSDDISTKFVTIKGEKSDYRVINSKIT